VTEEITDSDEFATKRINTILTIKYSTLSSRPTNVLGRVSQPKFSLLLPNGSRIRTMTRAKAGIWIELEDFINNEVANAEDKVLQRVRDASWTVAIDE